MTAIAAVAAAIALATSPASLRIHPLSPSTSLVSCTPLVPSPSTSSPEESAHPERTPREARPESKERARDGRSIYSVDPALDGSLTAAAVLVAALPAAFARDLITPRCPCARTEVNPLDRFAIGLHSQAGEISSDVTVGLALALPPALDALRLGASAPLVEDLSVYAETLAATGALVQVAKYAAQRPLPRTYAGEADLVSSPGGYRSFFSGHTALTSAALTSAAWTARLRDGERGWPWLVVAGATASVAVERVVAGRHFPSDVLVGAAVGLGTGTLVPLLHARGGPVPVALVPARNGAAVAGTF